ncbi:MAG: type II secretion system F family protein [Lachnospiraceae bacterium]|nr:type II secretion system F family protein [Lachnospiraceae bacterium]
MKFKKWLTWLVERMYCAEWYRRIFVKKHTGEECFRELYPGETSSVLMQMYHFRKIKRLLLGAGVCLIFSICGIVSVIIRSRQPYLEWQSRPGYYEGTEKETWVVRREDGSEQEVSLAIEERLYTKEEAMKRLAEGKAAIDSSILGENENANHVEHPLVLPIEINNMGITVQWMSDCLDILDSQGAIKEDFRDEEGAVVRVKGILRCQEYEDIYIRDFHVFPRAAKGDSFWMDVERELQAREISSREEEGFSLPEQINGEHILFLRQENNRIGILCVLGIVMVFLLSSAEDERILRESKLRREQLLVDYPELVSKLIVLMRAGMTTHSALDLISSDYVRRREKTGIKRYAYEELLITCREIRNGMPQDKVYERLGKRCGLVPYMRLGGLLTQNLKRGSSHLFDSLNQEAREAFEERKRRAKKTGEEAGTRMLMPMMLLLVTTIVIVLYPAFVSFQI